MRQLRYHVAMSLDGFIAGPNGEYDWIIPDPTFDFVALFKQFDTCLMGRRTYEVAMSRRKLLSGSGQQWIVVSKTLNPKDHPDITILSSGIADAVAKVKAQPGKDIWLFGGGVLFRSLLDAGLVDSVEVVVMPILLGSGVPLLPAGARRKLNLESSKALPSGNLVLAYSILPGSSAT